MTTPSILTTRQQKGAKVLLVERILYGGRGGDSVFPQRTQRQRSAPVTAGKWGRMHTYVHTYSLTLL